MKFEEILASVGDFGNYQKKLIYIFLIPISVINPIVILNLIFTLSTPDHWCHDPIISTSNLSLEEKHLLLRPIKDGKLSKCKTYDLNFTDISHELLERDFNFSTFINETEKYSKIKSCSYGWEYDEIYFEETASSKWDLVCDRDYLPSLVFTLVRVGSVVGTPILGAISDRIGRKPMFFILSLIGFLTSFSSAFVPWFIGFIVLRSVFGVISPLFYQMSYILMTELVPSEMRTRINGIVCIFWTLGMAALPLIAYLSADWSLYTIICSVPLLFCFAYYRVIPESPRWQISRGRYKEATHTLMAIAKTNNRNISAVNVLSQIKSLNQQEEKEKAVNLIDIFRYPRLRRQFILICLIWATDLVAYEGFHINISNLYGNPFINFLLMAVVEIPSYVVAWYMIESRLGRRLSNVVFLLLSALACYIPLVVSKAVPSITIIASLIGKFGCAASFMIVYQQAAEIFPTPVRTSGMGSSGTVASCFSVLTPYIIYLGVYDQNIPFSIIGTLNLIASILGCFLPETLNENLPQTMEEGEDFGKDQNFFSVTKLKKSQKANAIEETDLQVMSNVISL